PPRKARPEAAPAWGWRSPPARTPGVDRRTALSPEPPSRRRPAAERTAQGWARDGAPTRARPRRAPAPPRRPRSRRQDSGTAPRRPAPRRAPASWRYRGAWDARSRWRPDPRPE